MQNEFFGAVSDDGDLNKQARPPPGEHRRKIVKTIETLSARHDTWRVFSDFVEMSAIAISNAVDRAQFDVREARYMDIVNPDFFVS